MTAPSPVAAVCHLALDLCATTQQMRDWWGQHRHARAALTEGDLAALTARAKQRAREMGG